MKKIIVLTIAWASLLTTNAFADKIQTTSLATTTQSVQEVWTWTVDELTKKYDLVLRNNTISQDNEYNNKTYYTKKITTDNLVIPDEIKSKAKRIYFLVEEWNSIVFLNKAMLASDAVETTNVNKEYNYKTVPYVEGKTEYTFNTVDLVKDLSKWEYKSVTITLVAEFSDTEKLYLSNWAYVNIANKASILEQLKNEKDPTWTSYFGYYDTQSLETYLEKLGEKMTRAEYKKVLTNAQAKLKTLITKNESSKDEILNSIKKESDFDWNVDKYTLYAETNNLLNSVSTATLWQLQKLRSYDLIDSVFGK